jgi:hypothetical protein
MYIDFVQSSSSSRNPMVMSLEERPKKKEKVCNYLCPI